ncbi:MAG TPA: NADP-dependent isocitrate dehydrogenase, partial [Erysipelotrichaceae bacterium]|nr:NADP-dependent isocitrate dehydrogenase [Erysipelotrichaceae bacterium]
IFAWSGALRKRGEKDNLPDLMRFGDKLEEACLNTLNSGIMTKDLSTLATGVEVKQVNSEEFLKAIRQELEKIL